MIWAVNKMSTVEARFIYKHFFQVFLGRLLCTSVRLYIRPNIYNMVFTCDMTVSYCSPIVRQGNSPSIGFLVNSQIVSLLLGALVFSLSPTSPYSPRANHQKGDVSGLSTKLPRLIINGPGVGVTHSFSQQIDR